MKHSEIAEFFELDAVALAEKIRQNEVRPEALLQEAARRAQKHNTKLNALSDIDEATGEKLLAETDRAAALYGVAATKLAAMNQPWVLVEDDEELGLELPTNCVWDDNEQLCELARATRLAPLYAGSRGAEQALVAAGVEPKLGKCRDFLAILDALRGSVVEASDAASLSRECYRRLADACIASTADRAACANSFVAQRLILVPKPGGAVLVALRADEAYWDVSAHLRHTALDHYALSHHFDASLRTFFVDVLGVNPELLEEPAVSSNGHVGPGTGEPSTIQDGLRSADLAAPPSTLSLIHI